MTAEVMATGQPRRRLPVTTVVACARLVLGVGWIALMVLAVGLGERQSSFADLEDAVRSGDVDEVWVTSEQGTAWRTGPAGPWRGPAEVDVHWREGLTRYVVPIVEVPARRAGSTRRSRQLRGDDREVVVSLGDRLGRHRSDLVVHREDTMSSPLTVTVTTSVLDQPVYGGLATALLGLWAGTLLLLIGSPQPWRATRWGWFWLLGVLSPLGALAYLLLSGPTPFLAGPRDPARRITGGSGFLWSLGLQAASALLLAVT